MCLLSHSVQPFETLDCSLPASSVYGIFQARTLDWVAISSSRGSSQPEIELVSPVSSALQVDSLPAAPSGKPLRDCCPTLTHLDPCTSVKGISDGQFLCLTEAKVNCPLQKVSSLASDNFYKFSSEIILVLPHECPLVFLII